MEEKRNWKENPWIRGLATFLAAAMVFGIAGQGIYLKVQQVRQEKAEAENLLIQKKQEAYDRSFALAGQAAKDGDYPQAIEHIDKCLTMADPDSSTETELRMTKVSLQMLNGTSDQALPELISLQGENPESPEILLLKAQAELDTQNYEKAAADLEEYLMLNAKDSEVTQSLALLYEGMGQYQKASQLYRTYQELVPQDRSGDLNAARCMILAEDYKTADAILKEIIDRDPEAAEQGITHFLMAMSQMQRGDLEQAMASYEKAMALHYDPALCLPQIAACQFVMGDFEAVLETGNRYQELPDVPDPDEAFYQQLGVAAFTLDQPEQAIEYLTASIQKNAGYPGTYFYRGLTLLSLEEWEQAAEDFGASIDQDYLTTNSYYNRGLCYAELTDYDKAISDMERTMQDESNEELHASAEEFLPILRQEKAKKDGAA